MVDISFMFSGWAVEYDDQCINALLLLFYVVQTMHLPIYYAVKE